MSLGRRFLATGMTLLLATSITAAPARADDTFSGFGNSAFMSSMMDNVRMDSLHRHMQDPHDGDQPRAPDRKAGPIKPARPASPPAKAHPTRYVASPAVTARVREQFLAWIRQTSGAQGEAAMRQVMQQHDIFALWTKQMQSDGLRPGDLADAFAAYWVQNWQMANGVETTRPAQVMAVRRQVAASMAGFTEAQRQELAEVFMYNQFVQGTAWIEAGQRGDAAMKRKLGDAAVVRFRNDMKLDLRALKLTDRGFVTA